MGERVQRWSKKKGNMLVLPWEGKWKKCLQSLFEEHKTFRYNL